MKYQTPQLQTIGAASSLIQLKNVTISDGQPQANSHQSPMATSLEAES